jgi:hypothetical protein
MRRARLIAVVATLAAGALGVISSTQTWLIVSLGGSAAHTLDVPGAQAVPVLAPLSLAVLALGAALSIAGLVLRYLFGALTVAIAAILTWLTAAVAFTHPTSAIAGAVTTATGISGADAVPALVARIDSTAWPFVTLVGWVVLLAVGVLVLVTGPRTDGRLVASARRHRLVGRPLTWRGSDGPTARLTTPPRAPGGDS